MWALSEAIEPAVRRGVQVPDDVAPADLLARADAARCLAEGVQLMHGDSALGWVPPQELAVQLASEMRGLGRERDALGGALDDTRASRNALVASLGHELRTPINAIVGYAELLRGSLSGAPSSYVDTIWEAAHALLGTIDSVLDAARLQAGEARLQASETDIGALAAAAARLMSAAASSRELSLQIEIDAKLPRLWIDARMLRRVVINLLSNAIRYTGRGTTVTLTVRADHAGRVIIEILDEGPGMPAEVMARLEQPFADFAADLSPAAMGGLGLPLVKAMVELHGGSFRLLPRHNRGTRALVILHAPAINHSFEH